MGRIWDRIAWSFLQLGTETGREIERRNINGLQYGMQRFHRALSLTLMILSTLILAVESFREPHLFSRTIAAGVFILFCAVASRLSMNHRLDSYAVFFSVL